MNTLKIQKLGVPYLLIVLMFCKILRPSAYICDFNFYIELDFGYGLGYRPARRTISGTISSQATAMIWIPRTP